MKIEIDYPDDALELAVKRAANKALSVSQWEKGSFIGSLAEEVHEIVELQLRAAFQAADLSSVIDDVIQSRMLPTVREVVERRLKEMARKEVKAAMESKT